MEIANPIYDAVFKFLMEDKKAAALIKPDNRHLLDVSDTECPDECQVLIRRLARAVADKEVRQRMLVEDEIVTEFEVRDRRENELKALAEDERRQKEEERRQKEAALAELEQLKRQLGKL